MAKNGIPEVGAKVPDFKLEDQNGETFSPSSRKGKWTVLYFYPKDNTSGCTLEAVQFTGARKDFEKLGAEIVGVSPDSPKSHCNFIAKHDLGIRLLSDTEKEVLKKFGAWRMKKNYGREYMGVVRSTFLIAPDEKIAHVWQGVRVKGHVEEVLEKLKELAG